MEDLYQVWLETKNNYTSQRHFARQMAEEGKATSETRVRRYLYDRAQAEARLTTSNSPKILFFDLETTPLICYTWGLYDQNINPENVIQDWFILSYTAKWFGAEAPFGEILSREEVLAHNDSRIVKTLWKLLDEADLVIAHNLKGFDLKRTNTRFILNGLNPPRPYRELDTLQTARQVFGFSSNKLDYLNKMLGLTPKLEHAPRLFYHAVEGDQKALDELFRYNLVDTLALEELYVKLRPWMKNHPNVALYFDDEVVRCKNCGGEEIEFSTKGYATPGGFYYTWRCPCGAVGRSKTNELSKEKRKTLLT